MDMKKRIGLFLLSLGLLASSNIFASGEFIPGEVIVKYKPGMMRTASAMNDLYYNVGVVNVDFFDGMMDGFEHLYLDDSVNVLDAVTILQSNPLVEYAQPNYILSLPTDVNGQAIPCIIPGLPFPPGCEDGGGGEPPDGSIPCIIPGLPFPPGCEDGGGGGPGNPPADRPELKPAPGETPKAPDPMSEDLWGMKKIEAKQAWELNSDREATEIVVAVIDTGIDYNHEDLSANVWRNPNPTNNDIPGFDFIHNDGLPFDDHGHGSHTSGTVGAVAENGAGVYGVSPNVKIMGIKFLSKQGSGSTAGAVKAIDYAIDHGAKILSNSWGGPADGNNKALEDAVTRSMDKGALFVAAAGNDGSNNDTRKVYPAAFTQANMVTVAASDENDKLASFSNYSSTTVHLAAPGVNILSTVTGTNKYKKYSGTSMACPHVAGAAAYVWSLNPTWDYKQVKAALLSSADLVDSFKGKTLTGGRLNLNKASKVTSEEL